MIVSCLLYSGSGLVLLPVSRAAAYESGWMLFTGHPYPGIFSLQRRINSISENTHILYCCNTRYWWMANPFQTGTFTLQEDARLFLAHHN